MIKPVSLACGHSGCMKCLHSIVSLADNATSNTAPCPVCRQTFHRDRLHLNVSLNALTRNLALHCGNSGCLWKGTLEHARDHEKGCPKAVVKCPNVGCHHSSLREDMDAHSNSCEKALIDCPGCRKDVARSRLAQHQRRECFHSKIDCPLGCGTKLPRAHVCLHQHKCPLKALRCKVRGCQRIILRRDMGAHVYDAARSHHDLQHGEIQRLLGLIQRKETVMEQVEEKEEMVVAFSWRIHDLPASLATLTEERPLTSGDMKSHGYTWRAVVTTNMDLFLQLVSAAFPVSVEIRMVISPGKENETVKKLPPTRMREGMMWGCNLSQLRGKLK